MGSGYRARHELSRAAAAAPSIPPHPCSGTGGAVDTGADAGDTGADTGADTGGGTAPDTDGGGTTTPAQPANPGGAAPNFQSFCDENPGAC